MSTDLIGKFPSLPAMSTAAIDHVRRFEHQQLTTQHQFPLEMHHMIHGGVYTRTCTMPAGTLMTGALIKIATTLIIDGDCYVWLGDEGTRRINGHAVLAASAGRKQVFRALKDTTISMIFPTDVETVAEAEREFTSEADRLAPGRATTVITGEAKCPV